MYYMRNVQSGELYGMGDGFFGNVGNFFKKTIVGKALSGIARTVVSTIPGGKQLIAGGSALQNIMKGARTIAGTPAARIGAGAVAGGGAVALIGSGGGGMPALPSGGGGGASPFTGTAGAMLPDVLDPSLMRQYFKAPKGYVVVRDPSTGNVMAVRRDIAIRNHLWHAGRKPPISAGDWHKYQIAHRVEKKLAKIARRALAKHSHHQQHNIVHFRHKKAA